MHPIEKFIWISLLTVAAIGLVVVAIFDTSTAVKDIECPVSNAPTHIERLLE